MVQISNRRTKIGKKYWEEQMRTLLKKRLKVLLYFLWKRTTATDINLCTLSQILHILEWKIVSSSVWLVLPSQTRYVNKTALAPTFWKSVPGRNPRTQTKPGPCQTFKKGDAKMVQISQAMARKECRMGCSPSHAKHKCKYLVLYVTCILNLPTS